MANESHSTHSFDAIVTHVNDAEKFYVQPLNDSERKKLAIIENGLESSAKPLQKPSRIDDYVAVKIDGKFKRARLLTPIHHSLANVQLIDYGNEEAVPESCLYQLPSELGTDALRELAIKCAIVGVKVIQKNIQYTREIIKNRKVLVTAYAISSTNGELLVDIQTAEQASLRQHLTLQGICTPTNVVYAPWTPRPSSIGVTLGQRLPIIISHVNDLADFYVQLKTMDQKFQHMMSRLKATFGSNQIKNATVINMGMLCCVHLGVEWYRAEIVQVLLNGLVLVQLVDFGNYQHVTMKQIYPLEGSFLEQPYNAIHCSLNDITPTTPTLTGAFPKQLIQWFGRYVREDSAQFFATFVRESGEKYQIELFNDAENPNGESRKSTIELLIENNCARRVTNQTPVSLTMGSRGGGGMQAQLNQMSVEMLNNLRLQQQQQQQLYTMMNSGMPMGSMNPGATAGPGGANTAGLQMSRVPPGAYPGNNQPLVNPPQYMNGSSSNSAYLGLQAAHGMPASPVHSMGPGVGQQQQYPVNYSQSYTTHHPVRSIPSPNNNHPQQPPPHSMRNQRSRGEHQRQSSDIHEGPYLRCDLQKEETVTVELIEDPCMFVCLLTRMFDEVDRINTEMESEYRTNPNLVFDPARLRKGIACVAPFADDNTIMLYRARIESVSKNSVEVFFVDYGNTEVVDIREVRYLLKKFATLPETVIKCSFHGVRPLNGIDWGSAALSTMKNFFSKKGALHCRIKGRDPKDTFYVDLYDVDECHRPILDKPISVELEELGVFCFDKDTTRSHGSSRGRRTAQRSDSRSQISEDYPRSRGRRRSGGSASSETCSELSRAGFSPPKLVYRGYMDVRVCQVKTPAKFSVQLLDNKDALDRLSGKMQDYFNQYDSDYMDDEPHQFKACAVYHEDIWNRGVVLNNSYHGCQVILIDTQEVINTELELIRNLPPEFQSMPAQGVKCSLDGVKTRGKPFTSEACNYFRDTVSGVDLIAQFTEERNGVNRVLLRSTRGGMDVLVNALLVVKGHAVAANKTVEMGVKDVEALESDIFSAYKIKPGQSFNVSPSHVVSPLDFYIQNIEEKDNINNLHDELHNYYEDAPQSRVSLTVDSYCAANWDGSWYRAKILRATSSSCHVFFVDYGNEDEIPVSGIQDLNEKFKKFPFYAIHCKLEGMEKTNDILESIFVDLLDTDEDSSFQATFIRCEKGQYSVSMHQNGESILQSLFERRYASNNGAVAVSRGTPDNKRHKKPVHPHVSIQDRDLVEITHAETPHLIYIISQKNDAIMQKLSDSINQFYARNRPPLLAKREGELCAVQYSEDEFWYRAIIMSIHGEQVQVQFIDYGNNETKRPNEIFALDDQFRQLECQAAPCTLSGALEPPGGWGDVASEIIKMQERHYSVKLINARVFPPEVELFDASSGMGLVNELVKLGYAVSSEERSIPNPQVPQIGGGTFEVKVCYCEYPGRIYIQKMAESNKLEDLMERMNEVYGKSASQLTGERKIGTSCCTQYEDDKYFYRANIYGITRTTIKVQFIDFGNCEEKMPAQLYNLEDQFFQLSAQAIECSLQGCDIDSFKWTKDMNDYVEEIVHERTYNCQIQGRKQDAYIISLRDMATDESLSDKINEFIRNGCVRPPPPQQQPSAFSAPPSGGPVNSFSASAPPPAQQDQPVKIAWPPMLDRFDYKDAMVSWGTGPEDFYVNLVDKDDNLIQLQERLQEEYANGGTPVGRVFRFMFIAARSPNFDEVYRAKTLNNDRNNPTVIYVDYGNEEDVPVQNLYELKPYLATALPCQAIRCALSGVDRLKDEDDTEIKPEIVAKFEEALSEKVIKIKNIQRASKENPHNEVEICVGGENIVDVLEQELIAMSGPPDVAECNVSVGMVIKGKLTNITSHHDFWVQFQGEIAGIQSGISQSADSLKDKPGVNTYCSVKLGDGVMYRARVIREADESGVTVRCIDFGFTETVPLSQLYKLKKKNAQHGAQAFPCRLPLEVPEEKSGQVVEKLQEMSQNTTSYKIYSQMDETFVAVFGSRDVMEKVSSYGDLTLPDVYDVESVFTRPQVEDDGASFYISHSVDMSDFWVQKSDFDLDSFNGTITAACGGSLAPLATVTRGSIAVTQDNVYHQWNRALVTDIEENGKVTVLYLDYGNSEVKPKSELKLLPESLKEIPASAIHCTTTISSSGEVDCLDLTDTFNTVTADKEIVLKKKDGGVEVEIDGVGLAEVFTAIKTYGELKYTEPEVPDECAVTVTSPDNPHSVWVQLDSYKERLEEIMNEIAEHAAEAKHPYLYTQGIICSALFPDDETWYRGLITAVKDDTCTVKFVDYGNSCDVVKTDIRILSEAHLDLPITCVNIRLAHVRPADGKTWTDGAIDALYNLTADDVPCQMVKTSYRAVQHATLTTLKQDVAKDAEGESEDVAKDAECEPTVADGDGAKNRVYVSAALAEHGDVLYVPDPELLTLQPLTVEEGSKEATVVYVDSVDKIYVNLNEHVEELGALAPDEAELVTVDQIFEPLQCWAKWSECLYRAMVLEIKGREVEVWFMDYGNKDLVPVTDIWYLAPEHVTLAAQALPLSLAGVKPVTGEVWDDASKTQLQDIIQDQVVMVTVPAAITATVESAGVVTPITLGEEDVGELLKSKKVARSEVQPPIVVEFESRDYSVKISGYFLAYDDESACITVQTDNNLDENQAKLQGTIVEGHPDYIPQDVTENHAYVTRFRDDNQWYRCTAKEITGDNVTVDFVDYGNSQVSSKKDLQLLPTEFSYTPETFKIKPARLSELSEIDRKFISKILSEKEVEVEVTSTEPMEADVKFVEYTDEEEGESCHKDLIDTVREYSAAIGAYPVFPALPPETVVYTCEVTSPAEFYVQVDGSDEAELAAIATKLAEHGEKTKIPEPFVKQPVLAVYQGDLYRASVLKVDSKITVRFVDYGNSADVTEVYEITPEEVKTPPQAIPCKLDGLGALKFSDPQVKTFTDLVQEQPLIVVEAKQSDDTTVIALRSEEKGNLRMLLLQQDAITDTDVTVTRYETVPIPEDTFEVLITHVEASGVFFASRTGGEIEEPEEDEEVVEDPTLVGSEEYIAAYQAAFEEIPPPELAVEDVKVGTLCVTTFMEALYRAVIVSVTHDYAKVRFIDYGNVGYAPLSELKQCPESYRGPGLAVPFTGKLDDDKEVAVETEYALRVLSRDQDIPTVSIAPPRVKLLKYKYTKLTLDSPLTLYVSYMLDKGMFYCQSDEGGEDLEKITGVIPSIGNVAVPDVVVNAPVLATYEGALYRGLITEINGDNCQVLFLDYGNTETCKTSTLRGVTSELLEFRVAGINCKLAGVGWMTVEQTTKLKELVVDGASLTITPISYDKDNKQYTVKCVTEDGTDVTDAIKESHVGQKTYPELDFSFAVNTVTPLYCSFFANLSDFTLQREADTELLDAIAAECGSALKINLESVAIGDPCLVYNKSADEYSRGRVDATAEDSEAAYLVRCVDSGEELSVPLSALYDIPISLVKHKICGIPCREEFAVKPEAGWDESTMTKLKNVMNPETEFGVVVRGGGLDGGRFSVTTLLPNNSPLISSDEVSRVVSPDFIYPRITGSHTVFICVAEDPVNIYGQREADTDRLAKISNDIVSLTKTEEPLEDVTAGVPCVVKSVADEALYRAVVVTVAEENVTVQYVDYGNSEEVPKENIYHINDDLFLHPVYAIPLALESIEVPESWPEDCRNIVAEMCPVDAEVTFVVKSWDEDRRKNIGDVKLTDDALKNVLVSNGLVTNTDPDFVAETITAVVYEEVATDKLFYQTLDSTDPHDLYVSVANAPDDFYLQKEEWTEPLEELSNVLNNAEKVPCKELQQHKHCFAYSTECEGYYRAEVLSDDGSTVTLRYVDYGNTEAVSRDTVYELTEAIRSLPVYAIPASLHSTLPLPLQDGVWSEDAMATFTSLVVPETLVKVAPVSWEVCNVTGRQKCHCVVVTEDGTDVIMKITDPSSSS